MDEMRKDARFAHIARDPKFRRIPKAERKVKIDHRFKGMFKDEKFTVKYTIDKRGRPVNRTTTEDLRKYYDLSSSEDDDASVPSASKKEKGKGEKKVKDIKEKRKDKKKTDKEIESKTDPVKDSSDKKDKDCLSSKKDLSRLETKEECSDDDESNSESSDSEDESVQKGLSQAEIDNNDRQLRKRREDENGKLTSEIKEKLRDLTVNYARGEGVLLTDSSSEEESSEASGKILSIVSYIHSKHLYTVIKEMNLYFNLI